MASPLEGLIKNAIAKGFKGKLLKGTLNRETGSTVDEFGDVVEGTPQTFVVEGFADKYSEYYKKQAGIPETDFKITLILGNCETEPLKDDTIALPGWGSAKVRTVMIDPARASAECQVFGV